MNKKSQNESRRDFLRKGAAGLAGMAVLPTVLTQESRAEDKTNKKEHPLIHRELGKTGLKLPVVSMGVMNADNPADKKNGR